MKQALIYGLFFLSLAAFAQETDKHLPEANSEFDRKQYVDAEANYRISQSKMPKNAIASYNLGNSIYRQNKAGEAKYPYLKAIENAKDKSQKHQAFHNLGNVLMNEKDYTKAVEAYKNALRNKPDDEETRYNFALAKKMLKDNPPKDDKKDKKKDKKDDKKDKDQDKKDDKKDQNKEKEKDKENNKEGDKDKKDEGKNDKENQPKPKPGGISKERLQNLLDAVNNEEKKIQDKVKAKQGQGKPVQTEKDW